MFALYIFLLLGVSNAAPSSRIVNGDNADENAWPWQLSLRYYGGHTCGASLISEQYAVTAAHCVQYFYYPSRYTVIAGEHDFNTESGLEQDISIESIIRHPSYTGNANQGYLHDIAVLKLSRPATLRSGIVETVRLSSTTSYVNQECYITGWGRLYGNGDLPSILQEAKTSALSHNSCVNRFGSLGSLVNKDAHICAYTGSNGACNGDSGGPLVCKLNGQWELAGAASWVASGCQTAYPTAYVRIHSYVSWIREKAQLN